MVCRCAKTLYIILITLSYLLLQNISYAQNTDKSKYFDYLISNNLISPDREYLINLIYRINNGKDNDFTIYPVMENTEVFIFNEESNLWIGKNHLRSMYPVLSPSIKIKFNGYSNTSDCLQFEIIHRRTGEKYLTPCRKLWKRYFYESSLASINDKIAQWQE